MFRRKPTRIDLKVEDLQEYETMKREREQKNSVADKEPTESAEATSDNQKSKQANINERYLLKICCRKTSEPARCIPEDFF
ncbi:hypothetical protein TNCT_649071 [Trichonephila clavata]|uniref:Cell division cycle protein 26 homolog n=1 Tax=Trichonephila clavata TaxID=2740835 RepID=A0A8X6L8H2_TRICU|nr:hypothetical protein TNCT_649071 [Trichonephila clavata]